MTCNHNLPCEGRWLWLHGGYGARRSDGALAQVGDPVAQLIDRSANGWVAANGTTAQQPAVVSGGYLDYDGTDDRLSLSVPTVQLDHMTIMTITDHRPYSGHVDVGDLRMQKGFNGLFIVNWRGVQQGNIGSASTGGLRWTIWYAGLHGLHYRSSADSQQVIGSGGKTTINEILVGRDPPGGVPPHRGLFADLIIYNRELSEAEYQMLINYAAQIRGAA